jgi:type II secretory pathway pseudopilin PulG
MTTVTTRGFTVIELMLFLGITGAMFAALMIGVNGNITQQRYRESVQGLSGLLQDQFSEVANPRNERGNNWACNDGVVKEQPINGDPRGRSKCVLLGRAIQVANGGATIQTYMVVGVEPSGLDTPSDIETLVAYKPQRTADLDMVATDLDWSSRLTTPQHQPSSASYLILRSPSSGLIRVFTSPNSLPNDLATIITPANATSIITNCVDGQRGLLPPQSVSVDPRIAGPDSVVIKGNDQACV